MKSENGIYGYYDTHKKEVVYIGQSLNIFQRHQQHLSSYQYNNQSINRILQSNPFRYKLVYIKTRDNFTLDDRNILEKHYIKFYNTYNDKSKFNYTIGGDGLIGYSLIDKMGGLDTVIKLGNLGYTQKQICAYVGLKSVSSLHSYLSIRGVKWIDISKRFNHKKKNKKVVKKPRKITSYDLIEDCGGVEYIKEMSKKYNTQEIANYIGVSKNSLRSYLRKHDTSILILRYS